MYQISCDGFILHDVRLDKKYRVIDPSCKLELNTAGKLSFKIPSSHPYYDKIKKLSSVITLTQDGEWIFSGRVLNDEVDFRNIKTIEVEGELSYLADSNQRSAEYHNISVADYFSTIIAKHNAMVEEKKRFKVGLVTVTDPNDSLYRLSNYENTYSTIQDKLMDRLGGYIRIRHTSEGNFIDYLADYENINTQEINFGKNLLDLTQYVQGEDIATAIIPLGAKIEKSEAEVISEEGGSEERLTIKSVNNGVDYVYDEEAVGLYGWVFDTVVFDDVTVAENLLTKGKKELDSRRLLSIRLELNAIDLHLLDVDIERIKLGDKIRVVSEPHGINMFMMVSSMVIDIEDPAQNSIHLGHSKTSLTDITNNEGIKNKVDQAIAESTFASDFTGIKQKLNYLSETYVSKDEASSTYLPKTEASTTYLSKTEASETYVSKEQLPSEIKTETDKVLEQVSETYASKEQLSSELEKQADDILEQVSDTYASKDDLSEIQEEVTQQTEDILEQVETTYLPKTEASTTYLSKTEASETYATKSDVTALQTKTDEILEQVSDIEDDVSALKGAVSADLSGLLKIRSFTSDAFDVNPNVVLDIFIDITLDGYTPLGIVGIHTANGGVPLVVFGLTSSTQAKVTIENITANSINVKPRIDVLFLKNI